MAMPNLDELKESYKELISVQGSTSSFATTYRCEFQSWNKQTSETMKRLEADLKSVEKHRDSITGALKTVATGMNTIDGLCKKHDKAEKDGDEKAKQKLEDAVSKEKSKVEKEIQKGLNSETRFLIDLAYAREKMQALGIAVPKNV